MGNEGGASRLKRLRTERPRAPKKNFSVAHFSLELALREEMGLGLLRAPG